MKWSIAGEGNNPFGPYVQELGASLERSQVLLAKKNQLASTKAAIVLRGSSRQGREKLLE